MSSHKQESSYANEFENGSHLARKKKAEENQFRKKNVREILDLISVEDEDEDDLSKYARYIK